MTRRKLRLHRGASERGEQAQSPTPRAREAKAGALGALLECIEADPSDLDARAVYADALLELGDLRGELIALQLKRGSSSKVTARERELLKAHWSEWLGPLAPLLDKRRSKFERGFLHTAAINAYREAMPETLLARPEWSTVEVLQVVGLGEFGHEREPAALIGRIANLRAVAIDTDAVTSLVDLVKTHDGVRRLEVFLPTPSLRRVIELLSAAVFPNLEALCLTNHQPSLADLLKLLKTFDLRALSVLLDGREAEASARLIDELVVRTTTLVVSSPWGSARVSAEGAEKKHPRLRFQLHEVTSGEAVRLAQLLRALGVDRVVVTLGGTGARLKGVGKELAALGFTVG